LKRSRGRRIDFQVLISSTLGGCEHLSIIKSEGMRTSGKPSQPQNC
jgi:hypothetical protein